MQDFATCILGPYIHTDIHTSTVPYIHIFPLKHLLCHYKRTVVAWWLRPHYKRIVKLKKALVKNNDIWVF